VTFNPRGDCGWEQGTEELVGRKRLPEASRLIEIPASLQMPRRGMAGCCHKDLRPHGLTD
jgi:hypothetical protein